MFLAESMLALNRACIERHGTSVNKIQASVVGGALGRAVGGWLLTHVSREAVYACAGALFWIMRVWSAYFDAGCEPQPEPEAKAKAPQPDQKRMAVFMVLLNATPSINTALFFWLMDRVQLTPLELGVMEAAASLCVLAGTMLAHRFRYLPEIYAALLSLNYTLILAVLSRRFALYDVPMLFLPMMVLSVVGAAVGTEYSVNAKKDVAFWDSVPMAGNVVGFGLTVGLTTGLGVDHDRYRNLPVLVMIAGATVYVPMFYLLVNPAPEQPYDKVVEVEI